jgi:hypothetical protein
MITRAVQVESDINKTYECLRCQKYVEWVPPEKATFGPYCEYDCEMAHLAIVQSGRACNAEQLLGRTLAYAREHRWEEENCVELILKAVALHKRLYGEIENEEKINNKLLEWERG